MIRFESDYSEGAHPRILDLLAETNREQTPGYGEDDHCRRAGKYIRELCRSDRADVHFLVGGTQANQTVIASVLRPHQGVISACSGHINVHESGAIEATGHKVLAVDSADGKLTASQVKKVFRDHWMRQLHEVYPDYAFHKHKGYGSAEHMKVLRKKVPSPVHRYSFAPVREAEALLRGKGTA